MNINYADLFLAQWRNGEPRPAFEKPVYYFEYDGTHHAYEADSDIWQFLFWVAGIIHETTTEQQDDNEADDDFLDRIGVSYGLWSK